MTEEFELRQSQHAVSSASYNTVSQNDLDFSPIPPPYNDTIPPENPFEDQPGVRSPTKTVLTESQWEEIRSTLPPKSFSPVIGPKKMQKHLIVALSVLILCSLPLAAIPAQILGYKKTLYAIDILHGTTACSTGTTELNIHQLLFSSIGSSNIFNIDVGFGVLSFGAAKMADLSWDIAISRAGQALLGWVVYKVYCNVLLLIMERDRVSYDLYTSIALANPSLAQFLPVVKATTKRLNLGNKLLLTWVAISVLWVSSWPTITNAMTGYIPKYYTIAKLLGEDALVNFTDIATPTDLVFQFSKVINESPNMTTEVIGPVLFNDGPNITLWNELYKLLAKSPLDWPANIANQFSISNYNTTTNHTFDVQTNPRTLAYPSWYYRPQNQTFPFYYFNIPENVQCVASSLYQWGFSSIMTFIFAILNGAWVLGTYAVWMYLNRKSEFLKKGRTLGIYRAVVDLGEAIKRDLGSDICAYSNEELEIELNRVGGVKYCVEYGAGNGPAHIGMFSRTTENGGVRLQLDGLYGSENVNML